MCGNLRKTVTFQIMFNLVAGLSAALSEEHPEAIELPSKQIRVFNEDCLCARFQCLTQLPEGGIDVSALTPKRLMVTDDLSRLGSGNDHDGYKILGDLCSDLLLQSSTISGVEFCILQGEIVRVKSHLNLMAFKIIMLGHVWGSRERHRDAEKWGVGVSKCKLDG